MGLVDVVDCKVELEGGEYISVCSVYLVLSVKLCLIIVCIYLWPILCALYSVHVPQCPQVCPQCLKVFVLYKCVRSV